jgi:phenylacetic acid degradation operon negative regulatory protein
VVNKLERKGYVEIKETRVGKAVFLTESGKRQKLLYDLEHLEQKCGEWDGKWRVVFFDIDEQRKGKRDFLRKYLMKLGFKQMQKSVWISPYDCQNELKYIREVLDIPHGVKLGVLGEIENEEELKKWFDLEK